MKNFIEFKGQFSLHDSLLTSIEMKESSINFVFGEGLLYFDNKYNNKRSCPIVISIDKDSFDYNIIFSKRLNFVRGEEPIYVSRSIECKELMNLIKDGVEFEVFDEIYYENRLFWRCAVYKYDNGVCVSEGEELLIINNFPDKINFKVFKIIES